MQSTRTPRRSSATLTAAPAGPAPITMHSYSPLRMLVRTVPGNVFEGSMTPLLTIAPPTHELSRHTLDCAGGFLWWYADMLDQHGNGMVLIWSFGLPFLPGYAAAARAGRGEAPADRPSLNVSIYERGRLVFYLLQELDPGDAEWTTDGWRFGDSVITSEERDGVRALTATLSCPIPASDQWLRGTFSVRGTARRARPEDGIRGIHDWSPLVALGHGAADLRAGNIAYRVSGRAYHDCNAGSQPLHEAGIRAWSWGRVPRGEEERIYYVLWGESGAPEGHGVTIGADGSLDVLRLEARVTGRRLGVAGLRHPRRIELFDRDAGGAPWLVATVASILDDGPFYTRHFIRDDTNVAGLAEYCRTDLIDLAIHRPLVRMRVHRTHEKNSMWLPLFSGPRPGRLRRLLGQFGAT